MHRFLTGPQAQALPAGYRWLVLKGWIDLCPWYLIESQKEAEGFRYELLREIADQIPAPFEDWFPFARRQDCDEFAGFVIDDGQVTPEIVVVHLTFTQRPERAPFLPMARFPTLWAWLQAAVVPAWADWVDEEEVSTLLRERAAQ